MTSVNVIDSLVSTINITDARKNILTIYLKHERDKPMLQCPNCLTFYAAKSVITHIKRSKVCCPQVTDETIVKIKQLTTQYVKLKRKLYQDKYDQMKRTEKLKQECLKRKCYVVISNKEKLSKKQKKSRYDAERYQQRKVPIAEKYQERKDELAAKYRQKKAEEEKCEVHIKMHFKEIQWGPIFPCICCNR